MGLIGGGKPTPPKEDKGLVQTCPLASNPPTLTDKGGEAITKSKIYSGCDKAVKDQIHDKSFTDDEKKDTEEVLDKMKPLTRCKEQPVKHIGRSDKGITKKSTGCEAETSTMGEWFADQGTLVLTDAASNPVDFKDKRTQYKGTLAHELTHGLTNNFDPRDCKSYDNWKDNPLMQEWAKAAGWNPDLKGLKDPSKAPTNYAKTNPKEDLSESVMLYLYEPDTLKTKSPERYEFVQKLFGDKK
jgi:hypothetical protein